MKEKRGRGGRDLRTKNQLKGGGGKNNISSEKGSGKSENVPGSRSTEHLNGKTVVTQKKRVNFNGGGEKY